MNMNDEKTKYFRKLHLETQMFIEKGLFAVSSLSIPLLCGFSKHLAYKIHVWWIGLCLVLAIACFIVTIILQFISVEKTKRGYESAIKGTAEAKETAEKKRKCADRYKSFYFKTFILGLVFVLFTVIFHLCI